MFKYIFAIAFFASTVMVQAATVQQTQPGVALVENISTQNAANDIANAMKDHMSSDDYVVSVSYGAPDGESSVRVTKDGSRR